MDETEAIHGLLNARSRRLLCSFHPLEKYVHQLLTTNSQVRISLSTGCGRTVLVEYVCQPRPDGFLRFSRKSTRVENAKTNPVYRLNSVNVARIKLSIRVFGLNAGFAHRVNTEARTNENAWTAPSFDASCNAPADDRYAHFPTQRLRIRD